MMQTPFPHLAPARPETVITGAAWRFTVLTDALIRVEYDPEGRFTDAATQTVQCRDFPPCAFTVSREGDGVTLVLADGRADARITKNRPKYQNGRENG